MNDAEIIIDILRFAGQIKYEHLCLDVKELPSSLHMDAVLFKLFQIAENCNLISDSTKNACAINWRAIKGFRNVLAHDFSNFDLKIAWEVITKHLDPLVSELTQQLSSLNRKAILEKLHDQSPTFNIEHYKDIVTASALEIESKFLLLPGSSIYRYETNSLSLRYKTIREKMIRERVVYLDYFCSERFFLLKPLLCRSVTEAACIVCGTKKTGSQIWFEEKSRLMYWSFKQHNY